MNLINKCRACSRNELKLIFKMENMPLAGEFSNSYDDSKNSKLYPLTWVQCQCCLLTQVLEDIPDNILFKNYNYSSSTIKILNEHFLEYSELLKAQLKDVKNPKVLEIGCNDGVLLSKFPSNFICTGVDPSDIALKYKKNGYELINEPFGDAVVEKYGLKQYDLITASNCLAHLTELKNIFENIHKILKDDGLFFIEVHDLQQTLKTAQWDTIYHEHKVEWSIESLQNCICPIGFEIIYSTKINIHSGSLRVGFKKCKSKFFSNISYDYNFSFLIDSYKNRYNYVKHLKYYRNIVAYGASGRANVWCNQMKDLDIKYFFDDSKIRIGKWIPNRSIEILDGNKFLSYNSDCCIITAWNYADFIKDKYKKYDGAWSIYFKG